MSLQSPMIGAFPTYSLDGSSRTISTFPSLWWKMWQQLPGRSYIFSMRFYIIYMRIILDLKKISGTFNYKGKIKLRLKIGEVLSMASELSSFIDGNYAFLEKQYATVDALSNQASVELSIVAETGVLLAQKTIFLHYLRSNKPIELKNKNEIYFISYDFKEMGQDMDDLRVSSNALRVTSQDAKGTDHFEETGKLQILKIGKLVYDFTQRLDPLIFIYHKLIDLVTWKYPYKTVSIGVALTLMVYNLKMAIFLAGLLLYFGRSYLFKKLVRIQSYEKPEDRLIIPQNNTLFLQNGMVNYCDLYQKIEEFLFSDDKTILVNLINLLCKMGIFIIIMLFIFQLENLIVMSLWSFLLMTSPYRNAILTYLRPVLEFVAGQYSKIVNKISQGLITVLRNSKAETECQVQKQFYFYKYERWWMMKGWLQEKKKFSDEDFHCVVIPKEQAPQNFAWVEEWKVDFEGEVDSDGFQYANDIKKEFNSNATLATMRRRRWKRSCGKLKAD